ncbi:MAG: ABC transporter substrate-binding protein [Burkholderiales bacterium]|nr:ABC transporter substrate-binding protein [Burkholderiales bacterium]
MVCLSLLATSAADAADAVRLGIANDLSGPFAALGAEARDGFTLALDSLGGKLGGLPVTVVQADTTGTPDAARQVVERFVKQERIDFFTGPIGSNVALAVGPLLFDAKVPYISANATPSALMGEKCNPWFFSASWPGDAHHEAAGKVAMDKGYKAVVFVAPNYPAGVDANAGFKRFYTRPLKSEIFTKLGQIDYAVEIAQIRAAQPDAVYFFLPGGMGINFIKQYVGAGLNRSIPLVAPGFSTDEDVIRAVGAPMQGILNSSHWNHDFDNPANKAFVDAFQKKYGRLPSTYAAQAWDAIQMIDAAVRDAKGNLDDKPALVAALAAARYRSVRGDYKLGANHVPIQPMVLREVARDAQGRLTNRTIGRIFDAHADVYGAKCVMPRP